MSFDEVRLPIEVERGASGGPGFLTNVVTLGSGRESRLSLWADERGEWDIGYGIDTRENALRVRNFFLARRGRARGFRFRDWTNYTTGDTPQGVEQTPDDVETQFQIEYTYEDLGGFTYTKPIFKPVSTGFRVFFDAVQQTTGWSLNTTTGIITFTSPPVTGVDITWAGDFDLPVRFDTDRLEMVVTTKEVITTPSIPIVELKL